MNIFSIFGGHFRNPKIFQWPWVAQVAPFFMLGAHIYCNILITTLLLSELGNFTAQEENFRNNKKSLYLFPVKLIMWHKCLHFLEHFVWAPIILWKMISPYPWKYPKRVVNIFSFATLISLKIYKKVNKYILRAEKPN